MLEAYLHAFLDVHRPFPNLYRPAHKHEVWMAGFKLDQDVMRLLDGLEEGV
jgi:hypothetical protein